ncbi:MAG: hypothetical protein AB1830_07705 [Pseudomonadota bacterium]
MGIKPTIDAIRILRGCGASGRSLAAGTVYRVPEEVGAEDAAALVRLGKAEACAAEPGEGTASEEPTAAEAAPTRRKRGE